MDVTTFYVKPETTQAREEFRHPLSKQSMVPLWEVLEALVPAAPQPSSVPALWRYDEVRALLMEAGQLITAREAERRVLILENPGLPGSSTIARSLFAGLQLILPGEIALAHRHTASAFRFVIESKGAYTAVDGERTTMQPGDLILTPSWTLHDHGNPSDSPAVWLDGLDAAIVNFLDASFAEHYPQETHPLTRKEGDALARYGANMAPLEYTPASKFSPVMKYPYSRSRDALDQLYRNGPIHPCHGVKLQYVNPATGGYPFPAIAMFLQLLPSGFRGSAYRATDATVYCVTEGRGHSQVGNNTFAWQEHDIFVVPPWCLVSHEAPEDAVLFSFSDRGIQKALGLWREETLG